MVENMAILAAPSLQIESSRDGPDPSEHGLRRILRALLERLPDRVGRARLRQLAVALGRYAAIADISVQGDFGIIQGSLDDSAVLGTYWRTKTWRPAFAQFFQDFFRGSERGIFLDIGANIGLTTIPIARNAAIRCFGFEPDPVNFRHLRNNVQVNCPEGNVQLFNLALFDRAGSLDFQLSPSNKGDHRLLRGQADGMAGERQWPIIRVPTARLDDVLSACLGDDAAPIAAKIVVQGAEAHIVAGGRSVLSRAGAVLVEVYPYGIERLQGEFEALIRFCVDHFALAALNSGEQDNVLAWVPVKDATDRLRGQYLRASESARQYFHLFLKR